MKFDTQTQRSHLVRDSIQTPFGPMVAISDESGLHLLEFEGRRNLVENILRLQERTKQSIITGSSLPIESIKKELTLYFQRSLTKFETQIHLFGTPFQIDVWKALLTIPCGTTRSYQDISTSINKFKATRATATAIGSNQFALLIPCHRVINKNGNLGGYAAGLQIKQSLLTLETNHLKTLDHSHSIPARKGDLASIRYIVNTIVLF